VPVCRLARHAASPPPIPPYRPRRYPSDTTDAEWALLEPLLPAPASVHGRGGRPEAHHRRDIVDAIRYVTHNGCVWRALPCDFPPWRTVYGFYWRGNASGATSTLHDQLHTQVRLVAGRHPIPSARSSTPSRCGPPTPSPSKAAATTPPKVNGRKRHLAVDTLGLLLAIVVTAASVQDRDGARPLLCRLRLGGRGILLVWADAAYAGRLVTWARSTLRLRLVIVRRRLAHAFEVLPRRWVIERTFAWLSRYRRTVRDYERLPAHHQAMVQWAMTIIMTRRYRPARTPTPALATAA
jgi:transposase